MTTTDRTSKHPGWRSGRLILWALLIVLAGWLLLMLRWLVFPSALSSANTIQDVDAVYVLGEATPERLAKGIAMIETGASDQLVVTVTASNRLHAFCSAEQDFEVHCISPQPETTRGEARRWTQLAGAKQWDSVAIVTMRPHATRTSWYFQRCFTGRIAVIDDEVLSLTPLQWAEQFVYETGAMAKFAMSRGC